MAETGASSSSTSTNRMCSVPERAKLHLAMTVLQFGYAGSHVIMRIALNLGTSKLVFLIYRNIIGLLLLSPFAYFLEKKDRPAINASLLMQFFLLALVGATLNQGLYFIGLANTSPTFASAIENSVPAITFILAAVFRVEQVHLNRRDGIAKVIGTLSCVTGALIITLYKGPTIFSPNPPLHQPLNHLPPGDAKAKNWTVGCLCLIGHCLCWASWIVLQAPIVKKYPARISLASYACFFGLLQYLAIAAFLERDLQAWQLHSTSEFLAVVYAGVVGSGLSFSIQIWVIDRGGPVFVAAYLPLQTLLAAVLASVVLGEKFYLGSIIGAVLIVAGLYLVVWGKSEERKFAAEKAANSNQATSRAQSLLIQLIPRISNKS